MLISSATEIIASAINWLAHLIPNRINSILANSNKPSVKTRHHRADGNIVRFTIKSIHISAYHQTNHLHYLCKILFISIRPQQRFVLLWYDKSVSIWNSFPYHWQRCKWQGGKRLLPMLAETRASYVQKPLLCLDNLFSEWTLNLLKNAMINECNCMCLWPGVCARACESRPMSWKYIYRLPTFPIVYGMYIAHSVHILLTVYCKRRAFVSKSRTFHAKPWGH